MMNKEEVPKLVNESDAAWKRRNLKMKSGNSKVLISERNPAAGFKVSVSGHELKRERERVS